MPTNLRNAAIAMLALLGIGASVVVVANSDTYFVTSLQDGGVSEILVDGGVSGIPPGYVLCPGGILILETDVCQ